MTEPRPTTGARATGAAYADAVRALVGDTDPLEIQRRLVDSLRALVGALTDDELRRPESEGKWSIADVVGHLVDAELVHGYRLRMMLTHDEPALAGYDQDAFVERMRFDVADIGRCLDELAMLRDRNLRLLATLRPDERSRAVVHGERGRETVEMTITLIAGHDLVHLQQVDRIRAVVAG